MSTEQTFDDVRRDMKTDIVDWFSPKDDEHMKAWKYLEKYGSWPAGFIPSNVKFSNCWQIAIVAKMAQCWVNHMAHRNKVIEKLNEKARKNVN